MAKITVHVIEKIFDTDISESLRDKTTPFIFCRHLKCKNYITHIFKNLCIQNDCPSFTEDGILTLWAMWAKNEKKSNKIEIFFKVNM